MHVSYKILGFLSAAIFIGVGTYIILTSNKLEQDLHTIVPEETIPAAWVEILEDTVSTSQKNLETGDKILVGTTIISSNTGRAILHFPDNSTATIDPDTTVTLDKSLYTPDDSGMIAKILLSAGKVFFSITELATPQSKWEIKTGNAVAVVRGTVFSVEYDNGLSKVEVTEDTVSVATLDPKTNEAIPGTEVLVEENSTAAVLDKDAQNGTAPSITKTNVPRIIPEVLIEQIPAPQRVIVPPVPQSLIINSTPTERITEGDTIQFDAIVSFDDGTIQDVTQDADWEVLGTIGNISDIGFFEADIPLEISERGLSSGTVIATWNDDTTGNTLLGQTDIFEVHTFVEVIEGQQG